MAYSRADLLEYERLFNLWCDAQKAAHASAIAIMEGDLEGRSVPEEQRQVAAKFAIEARRLMMETLRACPPGTNF
jgi:hypothetical protein